MSKDYYKTLGVSKNASKDEIKKAFHKLAHEHHPDRGGKEEKFKEINEAYQILSDDKKRAQFDRFGAGDPTSQGFAGQGWDFSSMAGMGDFGHGEGMEFDLGDIFSDFFGGSRSRRRASRRGEDITVDIEIPLTDALLGAERIIKINKYVACVTCKASGVEPGSELEKCPTCGGRGSVKETRRTIFGTVNVESICRECDGVGKWAKTKCHTCKGVGIIRTNEEVNITIPSGIVTGEAMKLSGKGEAIRGGPAGDLYIRLHVKTPTKFSKKALEALEELRKEGI